MLSRVLLFDAGNTIVELDYAALARICAGCGAPVDAADLEDAIVRARPALDEFIGRPAAHSGGADSAGSTESTDTRLHLFGLVFDRLGVPPARRGAIGAAILPVLQGLWGCPTHGADQTLTALKGRGHRLGVVSNSDGTVADRIEEAGLARHFEVIVDSGAVGVEKPDPEIFYLALRAMGVAASDTTYFGDMPSVDVSGARRAGITPVLIDPLDLFPGVTCRRIRGLPDLLADKRG